LQDLGEMDTNSLSSFAGHFQNQMTLNSPKQQQVDFENLPLGTPTMFKSSPTTNTNSQAMMIFSVLPEQVQNQVVKALVDHCLSQQPVSNTPTLSASPTVEETDFLWNSEDNLQTDFLQDASPNRVVEHGKAEFSKEVEDFNDRLISISEDANHPTEFTSFENEMTDEGHSSPRSENETETIENLDGDIYDFLDSM